MKNAFIFLSFVFSIFIFYLISYFRPEKSAYLEKSDLESAVVKEFSYSTKTAKDDLIFIQGANLVISDVTKVDAPTGYVKFKDSNDKIFFSSKNAELYEKSKLFLKGSAKLKYDSSSISSNIIKFDSVKKEISSDLLTILESPLAKFEGVSFLYDVDSKRFILNKPRGKVWSERES